MNAFDDADAEFQVLINDEGQHSLWPLSVEAPGGWRVVRERDSRAACLAYIEEHWTDIRPRSTITATKS
ncbi:MbtH family protein [Streptomyces sp. TS71-3]|uniref:MbtH family protein n=1 Tax=Streptomyces sp. TS71-3 TaxID=2733862 RepID=UPI001B00FA28|nr:MbtH family protein [Streptomyces sp. TS71-3]GHJ42563.1 protein mbtH [Streptomyces sp. TS71-3]